MNFEQRIKAAAKKYEVDINLVVDIYSMAERIDGHDTQSKTQRRNHIRKKLREIANDNED